MQQIRYMFNKHRWLLWWLAFCCHWLPVQIHHGDLRGSGQCPEELPHHDPPLVHPTQYLAGYPAENRGARTPGYPWQNKWHSKVHRVLKNPIWYFGQPACQLFLQCGPTNRTTLNKTAQMIIFISPPPHPLKLYVVYSPLIVVVRFCDSSIYIAQYRSSHYLWEGLGRCKFENVPPLEITNYVSPPDSNFYC